MLKKKDVEGEKGFEGHSSWKISKRCIRIEEDFLE